MLAARERSSAESTRPRARAARQKVRVLVATDGQLREHGVVGLHTPACRAARVLVCDWDESLQPAGWCFGRFGPDLVGVVAKVLVKGRVFAKGAVNLHGALRVLPRVHIGLHAGAQGRRRVRVCRQDCLAAYDHDVRLAGHVGRGADDVFQLVTTQDNPAWALADGA